MKLIRVQFGNDTVLVKRNLLAQTLAKITNCPAVMLDYDTDNFDTEKVEAYSLKQIVIGEPPEQTEMFLETAIKQFVRKKERRKLLYELVDRKDCFQVQLPDNIFYFRKWRFLQTLAHLPGVSADMSNEEIADLAVTVMDMDELKKCIRGNIPQNIRTFLHEGINQILDNEKLRTRLNNLIQNATQEKANLEVFEKTFIVEFQGKDFQVMQGLYHELGNIDGVSKETTNEEFVSLSTQIPTKHLEYLIHGERPEDLKTFIQVATKKFLEDEGRRGLLDEKIQRNKEVQEYLDLFVNDLDDFGMFSDSDNPFE